MKNTIYIDIDTDREQVILLGKGADSPPPTSPEEAKEMVLNDVECMTEALISLMHLAHENKFGDKEVLFDGVMKKFFDYRKTFNVEVDIDQPTEPSETEDNTNETNE